MATVHDQFVGVADEVTYGTPVAASDFYEIVSEDVTGVYERIESEGIRGPVLREDRFAPNPKGAEGGFEFEILDKGFDFWLPHMFGTVNTAVNVHTATLGSVQGKSFAFQAARYATDGTLIPFTYSGGKVAEWEIACEVDAIVKANLTLDFAKENIGAGAGALALATAVYPAATQLMTFIGASVTIGGTAFDVSSATVAGTNGLKTDRYAMRGANSTTKREPLTEEMQEITFELTGEFDNDAHAKRVAALVASGVVAEVVLNYDSPQGGALDITIPVGRFDEAPANAARQVTEHALTGKALAPTAGGSPITAVYTAAV